MKPIELKYPLKIIRDGKDEELKYLTPSRLQIGHIELLPTEVIEKMQQQKDGKLDLSNFKELFPMFKELMPFMASIFNISIEEMRKIDLEDFENVFEGLGETFSEEDAKKN